MTKSTAEEGTELSDIQIQEAEEGQAGGMELDSKSSQPQQVPEAPWRGCGLQMWRGKVEGGG